MAHETVLEEYAKNDFEYIDRSEDMLERRFWKAVANQEGEPYQPIIKNTTKIVRTKVNNIEYFWYEERLTGFTHVGNEKQITIPVGKYKLPKFRREFDPQTSKIIGKEITRHETVYEIPFDKSKIEDLYTRIFENEATFYVDVPGGSRYRIYSPEDFAEATFEELVRMGKESKSLHEIRVTATNVIYSRGHQPQQSSSNK